MPQKKEAMKNLRTSLLSRGFSLAKASLMAGKNKQLEYLVHELGQLKGTAMKVGQTLSMYGEHLLPKEVTDLLKTLQQNSAPLCWEPIEKVLQEDLGAKKLAMLEVEHDPVGSASIGQVHRAKIIETGEILALKVQYPGVDHAIASDLKLLKFILNMSDLVPRGPKFDQIFLEIREMFEQEIDYKRERAFLDKFYELLKNDPRYLLPNSHPEFSTRRVLAMDFVSGLRIDSAEVQALPQERRNAIGMSFLDLYLRELLVERSVQTDPHLGNYLVAIDPAAAPNAPSAIDQLVLFDFGAVREVPELFLSHYALLMAGGLEKDARKIEKGGRQFNLLQPEDSIELVNDYVKLVQLILEPFEGMYDWGTSDLPKRVAAMGKHIAFNYKLRTPPRELVFLDRKLGGAFIFLSVLKCKMDARPLLEKYLASLKNSL
jgi:predicted unusual protein kinase regulating ubiquinone biosynthesis (AarF/ABC1/UbiB family)